MDCPDNRKAPYIHLLTRRAVKPSLVLCNDARLSAAYLTRSPELILAICVLQDVLLNHYDLLTFGRRPALPFGDPCLGFGDGEGSGSGTTSIENGRLGQYSPAWM